MPPRVTVATTSAHKVRPALIRKLAHDNIVGVPQPRTLAQEGEQVAAEDEAIVVEEDDPPGESAVPLPRSHAKLVRAELACGESKELGARSKEQRARSKEQGARRSGAESAWRESAGLSLRVDTRADNCCLTNSRPCRKRFCAAAYARPPLVALTLKDWATALFFTPSETKKANLDPRSVW